MSEEEIELIFILSNTAALPEVSGMKPKHASHLLWKNLLPYLHPRGVHFFLPSPSLFVGKQGRADKTSHR